MRVIGVAGWSGAGKTALITRLLPVLCGRGLRVSTVKRAHHEFDIDQPGKDSYAHRAAGATEVLVSSARRWALLHEQRGAPELSFEEAIARLSPVDLVIVEGFKHHAHDKIEVHDPGEGKELLAPNDPHIIAVCSAAPLSPQRVPVFTRDDVAGVAAFIIAHCGLAARSAVA
ncbi:MAG: molybdopterin-guanine dinucleotide biosynthesis protein B [Alphaproteobacteria bacterium]|nr:molybdopterin-guanine dinucleotide biosynthesis protein B [Alphaproteobacteria bacterium]